MDKTLNGMLYSIIVLNELDGNLNASLRFSDPDGVLSGKSGWSFGPCQFDTQNNSAALACLRECGFTEAEIQGVVKQTIDVKPLAAKLKAHADVVERYSTDQLTYCLNKAVAFVTDFGIPVESPGGILAGADAINQYGSLGQGSADFMRALGHSVTADDFLTWRLQTKYGREHPDDCKRRIRNVIKTCNNLVV